MVRQQTVEEIQEQQQFEATKPAEKFNALDYTKAIASTMALDGGSIASLIKDGRVGWLKYTENMTAADLAKVVATLVIFTAAGNLKPTKSGAISFARSKGNKITPSFKERVEKAVEKYNEQPRGKQLEGLQKIRQSSVDTLTEILKNTKGKLNRREVQAELEAAKKKLNEGIERVKTEAKRNADEAAQVERVKEKVRQEKQKTKFEKANDKKVSDYIRRKKAYDAKVAEIKKNNPNAFKTEVSSKTRVERRQEEIRDLFRDPKEVAKEQAEIARLKKEKIDLDKEKGLIDSEAKQAQGKESGGVDSKASESKTEKPNSERQGSKEGAPSTTRSTEGTVQSTKQPSTNKAPSKAEGKTKKPSTKEQAKKQADKETKERRDKETKEALEKSEREDKPDFSDPPNENEPLLDKTNTKASGKTKKPKDDSVGDEAPKTKTKQKTKTKEPTKTKTKEPLVIRTGKPKVIDKVVTTVAGAAAAAAAGGGDDDDGIDEEPPVIPMDLVVDTEPGFTTETVKDGEPETQPTTAPAPAPSPAPSPAPTPSEATASISFINHKEKLTQTTKNIDDLFSITIQVATDVYDNKSGEQINHYYFGQFSVPVLFFISKRVLYIGFRGTDSISNVLTDLTTADIPLFKNNTNSNFLYDHHPFDKLPDGKGNIEFFLGVILSLKQSYKFIVNQIGVEKNNISNIVLCGHSLGGAMAQLFTYIYNSEKHKIPIAHLVTYGQPRVLINEPKYIIMFNETVKHYHRVWNTLDPVPYVPFKKKVMIDKLLGSSILSGYTHVGNSFNVAGNIVNNDINLLLYEILKGNKENIEMLLSEKSLLQNSKLLKFMLSDKYLELQLDSFYKCLEEVEVKEKITDEQLSGLILELQKDTTKLLNYSDKCELLRPFGLSEILKANPIGDDLDEENFSINAIAGSAISMNKMTSLAHKLEYYKEQIEKLIARQIDKKIPIFETIDKVDFYEPKINLFDSVIGMIESDNYNYGDIIRLK